MRRRKCTEPNTHTRTHTHTHTHTHTPHTHTRTHLAQAMYTELAPRYVAVHLRLGGLTGEKVFGSARSGGTPLGNFLKSIECANRMAKHAGITAPIMFVADHHELRDFLRVVGGSTGPHVCVGASVAFAT